MAFGDDLVFGDGLMFEDDLVFEDGLMFLAENATLFGGFEFFE